MVSVKTGHVFEKDLILQRIAKTGQCPVTGVELNSNDLVDLQVPPAAQPSLNQGIPSMVQTFQTEWESVMLEVSQMRRDLEQTRRELS